MSFWILPSRPNSAYYPCARLWSRQHGICASTPPVVTPSLTQPHHMPLTTCPPNGFRYSKKSGITPIMCKYGLLINILTKKSK
jgi:hypothetical protein